MHIDDQGHIVVAPREFQADLARPAHLINNIWLPGTPWAFPTYTGYCEFQAYLADRLGVHPRNIVVRGSTKVGFSIAPRTDKVWVAMHRDSDLDLAIVDPDYYHFFDREIRTYERRLGKRLFHGPETRKADSRRDSRRFYTYRYQDLPDIGCVQDHQGHLGEAPIEQCCGTSRDITAFIYRDWWCIYSRCEYDLRQLSRALKEPAFPHGGESPRTSSLLLAAQDEIRMTETVSSIERRCGRCGAEMQAAPNGQGYFCPRCDAPAADPGSSG